MFSIRKGERSDLGAVKTLERELFPGKRSTVFTPENYLALWGPFFFIAESDRLAGYAAGKMKDPETGWILALAVAPEYRRKGVGTMLTKTLLRAFITEGASAAFLHTRKSNSEAQELYRSEGFAFVREVPGHYPDGEAGVRMELRIP